MTPRLTALAKGVATAVLLMAAGCSGDRPEIDLTSTAFADGGPIPERFSCEGENLSPPLAWSGVPDGAAELAVTIVDPDAPDGPFVHWVLLGVDPELGGLDVGEVPPGARQGQASSENPTYIGPCPPDGEEHRYVFTVYALGRRLDLPAGAPPAQALPTIEDAAVSKGELVGRFGR